MLGGAIILVLPAFYPMEMGDRQLVMIAGAGILTTAFAYTIYNAIKTGADMREESVLKEYQGQGIKSIDSKAVFMGLEKSAFQTRGMGALVLTNTKLIFKGWIFDLRVEIPLENIITTDEVKKFGNVNTLKPMLKVIFTDIDGNENSAAWSVKDIRNWRTWINR